MAGPFEKPPFDCFVQSPTGLVLKANGDSRLIFHLSWSKDGKSSINDYIPKHFCTVKYNDLDQAVRPCMKAGKGCYMAKSDMKSAFRHLPVRKEDWCLIIMMARHPITGKKYFFAEKSMPFGHSISWVFRGFDAHLGLTNFFQHSLAQSAIYIYTMHKADR